MPAHALVVDDDTVSRLVLAHMLRRAQWSVTEAGDVPEASQRLDEAVYDAVFSDYSLPSGTGLDVLAALDTRSPATAFVLVTGLVEHVSIDGEHSGRLHGQLTKPISSRMLAKVLAGLPSRPTD